MAEDTAKKATTKSVSTKDVAALNPGADASAQGAHAGRAPDIDAFEPMEYKVVDEPGTDDGPAPYSTREGYLTDEEQIEKYGHVLEPAQPFVSMGMHTDIAQQGYTYDPLTRKRIERA